MNLNNFFLKCYTPDDLLAIYNSSNYVNNVTSVISKADFERMSAALVWMGITPECKQEWTPMSGNSTTSCDHTKERYLYGSVGIFLIWLCSFSAVFGVSRFTRTKYFKTYLVMCLRALAIGTLLGDALMHIIPSVS